MWFLGDGHAAYVVRGFGFSLPGASSPRAFIAGLLPAANARGVKEERMGTFGYWGDSGDVPYRGGTEFSRKKAQCLFGFGSLGYPWPWASGGAKNQDRNGT